MKLDLQWPAVAVFCAVTLALTALVLTGHMQAEALLAVLGWLIPGPWQAKPRGATLPPPPAVLESVDVEITP